MFRYFSPRILLILLTAFGTVSFFLQRTSVSAAPPFDNNPPNTDRRLTIYGGVLQVHSGGAGSDILEIGNAGRDIISSGPIYFRPGVSGGLGATAPGSHFSAPIGNAPFPIQDLILTGDLRFNDTGFGNTGIIESTNTNVQLITPNTQYILLNTNPTDGNVMVGSGLSANAQLVVRNHPGNGPAGGSATDAIATLAANATGSAVYAEQANDSATSYAGYFSGKVRIARSGAGNEGDLIVGGTATQGSAAGVSEICLNDDGSGTNCLSAWPVGGGGSKWMEVAGPFTYLTNTLSDVGIGGDSTATSVFWFDTEDGSTNPALKIRDDTPGGDGAKIISLNSNLSFQSGMANAVFSFKEVGGANLALLRETGGQPQFGIGTSTPSARLVVSNNMGNVAGSVGDAIAGFADTGNAAILGQQNNANGFAGYFSGRSLVAHPSAVVPLGPPVGNNVNNALEVYANNASGSALYADQQHTDGYAAQFFGQTGIFGGDFTVFGKGGPTFHLGGRLPGSPPRPWISTYIMQADRISNAGAGGCTFATSLDPDASEQRYIRSLGHPDCAMAAAYLRLVEVWPLEPNEYVLVVRARTSVAPGDPNPVFRMTAMAPGVADLVRDVYVTDWRQPDGGAPYGWDTFALPFRQPIRGNFQFHITPLVTNPAWNVQFDFIAIYPEYGDSSSQESREKVCSCVSGANWRSMTRVPNGWTETTCQNWCTNASIGGTTYNVWCINESGYSFTKTDCGW